MEETQKKPGRRKRLLLAVGVVVMVVAIIVVVMFWPKPKEPEYQGKKLSEWARYDGRALFDRAPVGDTLDERGLIWIPENEEGRHAVRQLGTNVLPLLVKWVRYERPSWKNKASAVCKRLPRKLVVGSIEGWLDYSENERLADGTVFAFTALGSKAGPAVPALIDTLRHTKNAETKERVILCLGSIGAEARQALPILTEIARKRKDPHWMSASVAIRIIEDAQKF